MRFREDRSQDSVTFTSKPFERVFCVVAMQKVEYKSFDSKKIPNQYDLSDESKARSKVHDKDYIRGDSMIFKNTEKVMVLQPSAGRDYVLSIE